MNKVIKIASIGFFIFASQSLFGMQWFNKYTSKKVSDKLVLKAQKTFSKKEIFENPLFTPFMLLVATNLADNYVTKLATTPEQLEKTWNNIKNHKGIQDIIEEMGSTLENVLLSRVNYKSILTQIPFLNTKLQNTLKPSSYITEQSYKNAIALMLSLKNEPWKLLNDATSIREDKLVQKILANDSITNIALDKFDNHQLKAYSTAMLYGMLQYKFNFKKYPFHVATMRLFIGGLITANILLMTVKIAALNNITTEYACDLVVDRYTKHKDNIHNNIISSGHGIMTGIKNKHNQSYSIMGFLSKFISSSNNEDSDVLEKEVSQLVKQGLSNQDSSSSNKTLNQIITSNKAVLLTFGIPIAVLFSTIIHDTLEGNIKNIPKKIHAKIINEKKELAQSLQNIPDEETLEFFEHKINN